MRAKALEFATKKFHQQFGSTPNQIISVGCGFDSGYFRLKAQGLLEKSTYVEVWYPGTMRIQSTLNGH